MAWLQSNNPRSAPIAATRAVILPETSTLYGVPDVRAYDVVRDPRSRAYWSAADPGYQDATMGVVLQNPGSEWLAAAGVHYVVTPGGQHFPGTTLVVLQSFADGWNATIDGHAAIVHPANVQFQAVLMPQGTHIVNLKYEPASVRIGMFISGAAMILLLLLVTLGPRWLRLMQLPLRTARQKVDMQSARSPVRLRK